MPRRPTLCFVCGKGETKYRFPCCRERYCSLPCYKVHAAAQCTAGLKEPAPKKQRLANQDENGEDETILSEVQLCALRGHAGVRDALRTPAFQQVLQEIDDSRDRRAALEAVLENNPYFVTFVEHMTEATDYFAM